MSIKMIRIDDRLIHGQVVAAWSKVLNINRIWVIDDNTAKDEFLSGVMRLVAPPHVELVITDENRIKELAKDFDEDNKNTLILSKGPEVMKKIFMTGISHKELNLGGMCARPDRTKLFKQISANKKELELLHDIKNMGIHVYFRVTPDDIETEFE
ncbi:PTS system mannose/fructose/N-acetylgalactosamine-transporter subunit IIB [Merdibacter massiliensis]|uniref:PTS system mannose/fructose/N-acetylgalactosamine-transporter subunit IIB n=1 Tax=Merdibacter massiliensis TaxID=1871030 RepID=UPI00096A94AE|nr:PTS sugar transporter subunit IIB [Merdibacter massiliensis]